MDGPAEIRRMLEGSGLTMKKRWGQNFLVDPGARDRLAALLGVTPGDAVWEIGGGGGALSLVLAPAARTLTVFEIDHGLIRLLEERLAGLRAVVVPGDFCKSWAGAREKYGTPDLVLGNLPYQSASRIIAVLATAALGARRIVLTVQRELGQRMTAVPSTKAYSSFSVLCQAAFTVSAAWDVSPRSFYPVPNVTSRVVVLEPRPGDPPDLDTLQRVTRGLFATRRKTMGRTLQGMGDLGARIRVALSELSVAPERRPEELDVETWIEISRRVRPIPPPHA